MKMIPAISLAAALMLGAGSAAFAQSNAGGASNQSGVNTKSDTSKDAMKPGADKMMKKEGTTGSATSTTNSGQDSTRKEPASNGK
jgi:hypothetical protein